MNEQESPIVMLFGTFHFANPKRDLVKSNVIDVMSESSQKYLEELTLRISQFDPTFIFLEYDPHEDLKINERYNQYRAGKYQLSTDEVEQLGFRIAQAVGIERLHSFDERKFLWKSERLFEQLKREPQIEKRFNEAVTQLTNEEHIAHSTLPLQDLLKRYNNPELDNRNKSLYLMTNSVGADEDFAGAEATASWWHRNFRMFARIQKFAHPGERLLVIGGQGHIAILRDLLNLDPILRSEEIMPFL